ncbi:MAG: hypothetical protein Q8P33_03780 [bacterium]|nr:hypothetical protein [bacterium]
MTAGTTPVFTSPLRLANFNTFNPKTSLHFAETYVFRPKHLAKFGELFVVLQIDHSTRSSPQVGDAIATILNHEYFRGNPTNVVQNLEDALHKTNEILSDLAARGEIHWIGKLHGIIGVFQKDSIHISATGRGRAFLIRDNEIAEVTAGLYDASRAASPMKTFENLASGELRDGDSLVLSTPGVTDYITTESLRTLVQQHDAIEAAKMVQERLGHDSSRSHASIIIKYDSKNALTTVPTTAPGRAPHAAGAKQAEIPTVKTYSNLATAKSAETALSRQKHSADAKQPGHAAAAAVTTATPDAASPMATAKKSSRITSLGKKLSGVFAGRRRGTNSTAAYSPVTDSGSTGTNISSNEKGSIKNGSLRDRLKKAVIRMPAKAKVFTALALLLVIIFVVSLFVFSGVRSSQASRQEITDKLNQAVKLEEDAAAAIIFKGFTQAQDLLAQSEALVAELPENDKEIAAQVASLKENIARDYEKLSGSVRIPEPTALASLSGDPIGLALLDEQLVALLKSGKVLVTSTKDGDTATGATLGSELGDPTVAAVDESLLVIVTDQDELVSFEAGQLDQLDVTGSLDTGSVVAAETYGSRLYLLDPEQNEITRLQRTIAGYGQGFSWILDGTSVEDAVDIAIDGNVWVLLKDGQVVSLLQGSREEFSLGPVVDPVKSPTKLVTSEDMDNLYILEPAKNRLLVFDKEKGDFVKQFVSDAFTDLRDAVINEQEGLGYLLNGDTIYQIDLSN